MKKIILFTLLFYMFCQIGYGQKFMYNGKGEKEYFTENNQYGIVIFKDKVKVKLNDNLFEKESLQLYAGTRCRFKIKSNDEFNKLKLDGNVKYITTAYTNYKGEEQTPTNCISVKLKEGYNVQPLLKQVNCRYDTIKTFHKNPNKSIVYLAGGNPFDVANALYETGGCLYAQPCFFVNIEFHEGWGWENYGEDGGVADVDIDADAAEEKTTGSPNVTVAVLDMGCELNHILLAPSLVFGKDATDGGDGVEYGGCNNYSPHGTACAGLVVTDYGVATDCKVEPIRIAYRDAYNANWGPSDDWQQMGFNYAISDGAKIISCSWEFDSPTLAIRDAIQDAISSGIVVVFSSGNGQYSSGGATFNISGIAKSNADILVVGAIDRCGKRAGLEAYTQTCDQWDSNSPGSSYASQYGQILDVVAPGSNVLTLDLMGVLGYNSGNTYANFGGTSAACPIVAGVAALVFSYYPEFTNLQVNEVICRTATKLAYYNFSQVLEFGTWNEEVGYGLVNANRALGFKQFTGTTDLEFYNYVATNASITGNSIVNIPSGASLNIFENHSLELNSNSTINIYGKLELLNNTSIELGLNSNLNVFAGSNNIFAISATLEQQGGTINVGNGANLTLSNYSIVGSGNVLTGAGYLQLTDNLTIPANAALNIASTIRLPDSKNIIVDGGKLIINSAVYIKDNNGGSWSGNIIVSNGGQIIINAGKSLTIDSGSGLVFNTGTYNLVNNGAIVIDGDLMLKANTSLTISGTGYIKLNGTINADPGANLTIQGVNKTTKLLEVQKSISFDNDFTSVTIKNGKIIMNNSTSELYLNQGVDNVTIDNVWVTSLTGTTNNGHQGIDIRSDGNISIANSKFERGYYGLTVSHISTAPLVSVSNSSFLNNTIGLAVTNGGFSIDGCTFENNTTYGLLGSTMSLSSTLNNSVIRYQNTNNAFGLFYAGSGTASLSIYNGIISDNYCGAFFTGSFNISAKCSSISNNARYGIYASSSKIYLTNAPGISGGNSQLYSNQYSLEILGSSMFYLNNGYNDLRSDSYCLFSTTSGYTVTTLAENNNYWKTGGGVPVINVNYQLKNASGAAITITDNSPENSFTLCSAPGGPLSLTQTATSGLFETTVFRTVTTDLGIQPLNLTVEEILNTDPELGTVYDLDTQFELLSQLLMNDLSNLNEGEAWYAKHSYHMFKSALGKFGKLEGSTTLDPKLTKKMLKVIRKLETDDNQGNGNNNGKKHNQSYFAHSLDEAQIMWLEQDYDGAITMLEKLLNKADAGQTCEIEKLICQINVDRDFIASGNTLEIEELLAQCAECDGTEKSGNINNSSGKQESVDPVNELNLELNLSVVPNPVTGTSEIRIYGLQQGTTLVVYNSTGAKVIDETIATASYSRLISNSELPAGIYLITLNQNGTTIQTMKMVVVK